MTTPGDIHSLALYAPGGPVNPDPCGYLEVIILNAGIHECDCIISPAELQVKTGSILQTAETLKECDVDLEDLREGPVYVLRNMNTEWLRPT